MFYKLPGKIYLDGNSLGLLSSESRQSVLDALDAYQTKAIDGWTDKKQPWFTYAEELAGALAPLVGARKDEIIIHASTTINIHVILASFFKPAGKRRKILIEEGAYPTDRYAILSHLRLRGLSKDSLLTATQKPGELVSDALLRTMEKHRDTVAMIIAPAVTYRTGELLDIKMLAAKAHRLGMLIAFDCSHSAGVVPHAFDADGVDFAVFCTYKYLNGGPGAPAGLYVNRRHFGTPSGIAGWWGSDKRVQFDMAEKFTQARGAGGFQTGTPHVLSMAPLRGSLHTIRRAGISSIRTKSLALTNFCIKFIQTELDGYGFVISTPLDPRRRGGHVALEHPYAAGIIKALHAQGVITDFRKPNTIRITPSPLYTTRADLAKALMILKKIMEQKTYLKFTNARRIVA